MKILVWFRQDLRLSDNPALSEAAKRGEVIPIYIWAPEEEGRWKPGHMSRVWLNHSLKTFSTPLVLRKGPTVSVLKELVQETGATALYFNRRYEPAAFERDSDLVDSLGIEVKTFNSALLIEPWEIKPYRVFTPFWKTALKIAPFTPVARPKFSISKRLPRSERLALPDEPIQWEVGEKAAQKKLAHFLKNPHTGSSFLSPYLHFGEIGPRQVWAKAQHLTEFVRQLFWREFAYHLLFHFPHTSDEPLREEFKAFPWAEDKRALKAWKEGKTGYPYIDAAMRQLLQTGWLPNRQRMAVASFLTKDLLIPWQEGAKWFWERLVDADLANNTLGWQWTAGCGADAAPYFRIFNPVAQGKQFDPDGEYVRRFVPELKDVPTDKIHGPQGVKSYPKPIVIHSEARKRALKAFEKVKQK